MVRQSGIQKEEAQKHQKSHQQQVEQIQLFRRLFRVFLPAVKINNKN